MAMHNAPRIGPRTQTPTEWDDNIQKMRPRAFDHSKHNQGARVAREQQMERTPLVWEAKRGYLGVGSSQLTPYGEYILPKSIAASAFIGRIQSVTEGERVELLPEGTPVGFRHDQVAPERVYVFRRSTAKEDFTITQGRVVRVVLTRIKAIYL